MDARTTSGNSTATDHYEFTSPGRRRRSAGSPHLLVDVFPPVLDKAAAENRMHPGRLACGALKLPVQQAVRAHLAEVSALAAGGLMWRPSDRASRSQPPLPTDLG